jgi:hypothetical protein
VRDKIKIIEESMAMIAWLQKIDAHAEASNFMDL